MSNWTEERVAQLVGIVGSESPVTQVTVEKAAEALEVSNRSVSAKLRKMEFDVEKVSARAKTFTDAEAEALVEFVTDNANTFTYAEVAEKFAGDFTTRQIQGKILSLELTDLIVKTPPKESTKTYSDAEEVKFIELATAGKYLEDIADALNRPLASVRGKALSLSRIHGIDIPKQRESHAAVKVDALNELGDISKLTVKEIAEAIGKTERGVKTMITHRGLECDDYKAKAKKEDKDA
jgi:hypothetical protein